MSNCRKFEWVKRVMVKDMTNFKLPERGTKKSAGYDFFAVENYIIEPGEIFLVRTGVKVKLNDGEFLLMANRSSNPGKKGLVLMNGIGVVDSDYYSNLDNDGEIMFQFMNISDSDTDIVIGEKLGQGIVTKFELVEDDSFDEGEDRAGGFGSTGN